LKLTDSLPITRLLALSVSVSTAPNRNATQAVPYRYTLSHLSNAILRAGLSSFRYSYR
jgi:hypothetical protein